MIVDWFRPRSPVVKEIPQFLRCRVTTDTLKHPLEFPKRSNAILLHAGGYHVKVLIDGAEEAKSYHWDFVKFEPNRVNRV